MKSSIKPLCKIKQFSLGTLVSFTNKTYCQDVNWNIVESGVKHHSPSPLRYDQILCRINNCLVLNTDTGMSLEVGNRWKSPVTLAVTAGYFYSFKKIMRENLSSISNTTYSACIYWSETTHIVNGTCYNHIMLTF